MPSANAASLRLRHRAFALAGAAVLLPLALSLAISFVVTPEALENGQVTVAPACTFKRVFGRPCPTCGLTRGFSALSHGHIDQATGYHRGVILVYALWWLGALGGAVVTLRSTIRYVQLNAQRTTPKHLPPEPLA